MRRRETGRWRLTSRGENVLAVLYALLTLTVCSLALLASIGLAGWIEGGCK